jgi:hypothetical protein
MIVRGLCTDCLYLSGNLDPVCFVKPPKVFWDDEIKTYVSLYPEISNPDEEGCRYWERKQ